MIRLLSILVRLAGDILACLNHIAQLLQEFAARNGDTAPKPHRDKRTNDPSEKQDVNAYTEGELCTVGEACLAMKVSRSTIDRLRGEGKLSSLEKNGRIRLIKAEIEAATTWYSIRKGKL